MTGTGTCSLDVLWDDRFREYDFGPSHPFSETSRFLAVRLLESEGFFRADGAPPPRARRVADVPVAALAELLRFHEPAYIDLVRRVGAARHPGLLDQGDTPGFPRCHEAAGRIAGGTLRGVTEVLRGKVDHAFNPAGGLHHAHPGRASGFCIYNDVALALRRALEGEGARAKVAYIDIDAHHGDGVMYGFYDDGRVLDIDFHQDGRTLFPGTGFSHETGRGDGQGLKVNLPLPPTAGDDALMSLFERVVPTMLRAFKPGLIVLQSGVDGHAGDPLAHLQYTPRGYDFVHRSVHELAHELCDGRLVATGGGGYLPMNVARVLARAAAVLHGSPLGARGEVATPEPWRRQFAELTGEEAPGTWGEIAPVYRSSWTKDLADRLVDALAKELGVRFPSGPA